MKKKLKSERNVLNFHYLTSKKIGKMSLQKKFKTIDILKIFQYQDILKIFPLKPRCIAFKDLQNKSENP